MAPSLIVISIAPLLSNYSTKYESAAVHHDPQHENAGQLSLRCTFYEEEKLHYKAESLFVPLH